MRTTNLGFPRIGNYRELKKAVEYYWQSKIGVDDLKKTANAIMKRNLILQKSIGIDLIPINDFSFYDQVLDMSYTLGVIPERFKDLENDDSYNSIDLYFAMARGIQDKKYDILPMEMTKWFNTNYHYIVPEFEKDQKFSLSLNKIKNEISEALKLSPNIKPVLIGPLTYLKLGKTSNGDFDKLNLLPELIKMYEKIVDGMCDSGIEWVQFDEPFLVSGLKEKEKRGLIEIYTGLKDKFPNMNIMLTSYFGSIEQNIDTIKQLPIQAFHIDLSEDQEQLDKLLPEFPNNTILSMGVINGRNIWKNNFSKSLDLINKAVNKLGRKYVWIAPSCSLIHCPIDIDLEEDSKYLLPEVKGWMAFSKQKLEEVNTLKQLIENPEESELLKKNTSYFENRINSEILRIQDVRDAVNGIKETDYSRNNSHSIRKEKQKFLNLPLLPTTTIGSFPQTSYIRSLRRKWKKGVMENSVYETKIKEVIADTLSWQKENGLDVLVHGEYERNDMVEYFAMFLNGYAFTQNGWVQSYGTRFVRPPIIFGDVSRKEPMTVYWSKYANKITAGKVKGMLTGPVTMLQWSFVRDDQTVEETLLQLALAIRDEVKDLEDAGINIIQIDEPAFREGMPLNPSKQTKYFKMASGAFRLSSSVVKDETQIHTHMCYSEFNEIIEWISAMDADVITIEASRSRMELLEAFSDFEYPNDIGPGIYDIHSPRVPEVEEMVSLLQKALEYIPADRLWVNPDCGLKTRNWEEVEKSLRNMVSAARILREKLIK